LLQNGILHFVIRLSQ